MIIGKDVTPSKNVYYLGGIILKTLNEFKEADVPFLDVFQRVSEKEKVSISLFTLTLDWLFILDVVKLDKGAIKKCF